MNQNLERLIKDLKITKNDLSVDITKDKFTFDEFYQLSLDMKLSLRELMLTLIKPDIYYSAISFSNGVLNGDINKVKKTILFGYVVNCNDILYFSNTNYRILEKYKISDDVVIKLFELLIQFNEWDIARKLSSKNLYYKFSSVDNLNINYLLGDISGDILSPDIYARNIYKNLDEESKKIVRDLMIMHYFYVMLAYKEAKKQGLKVKLEWDSSFFVSKEITENNREYQKYFIDDLYQEFDQESQKIILKIFREIK